MPGHWESDQLFGDAYSQITTLVERHTRYLMLVKLVDNDLYTVVAALARHIQNLLQQLYRSLNWDRGLEMTGHKRFTVATDIQVYFCDPQNPWQRGTNENTNGLLRQYLSKGIDLPGYSQDSLDAIARQLNQRPRKTLDYRTPAEMFDEFFASITSESRHWPCNFQTDVFSNNNLFSSINIFTSKFMIKAHHNKFFYCLINNCNDVQF